MWKIDEGIIYNVLISVINEFDDLTIFVIPVSVDFVKIVNK
jgi:hypothetical protein